MNQGIMHIYWCVKSQLRSRAHHKSLRSRDAQASPLQGRIIFLPPGEFIEWGVR